MGSDPRLPAPDGDSGQGQECSLENVSELPSWVATGQESGPFWASTFHLQKDWNISCSAQAVIANSDELSDGKRVYLLGCALKTEHQAVLVTSLYLMAGIFWKAH